jgi:hypothetical protein
VRAEKLKKVGKARGSHRDRELKYVHCVAPMTWSRHAGALRAVTSARIAVNRVTFTRFGSCLAVGRFPRMGWVGDRFRNTSYDGIQQRAYENHQLPFCSVNYCSNYALSIREPWLQWHRDATALKRRRQEAKGARAGGKLLSSWELQV